MRTAVIGCSHSAGYQFPAPDGLRDHWHDNNWAEIYINNQNKDGVIFACPGRGWYDYSERLAFLFKTYNDIDEVIIQQTYWNRYRFGYNTPNFYENIIPLETHMMLEETKGCIDCYNISMWNDQLKCFDGGQITVAGDYAIPANLGMTFNPFDLHEPNLQTDGYQRLKANYELMTVINQRQFFKEVYIWNTLCKEKNAKLKIFAMNDLTWLPKDLNIIGDCSHASIATESAEQFLKNNNAVIKVDDEHFDTTAHKLIANEFVPNIGRIKQ